MFVVAGTGHRPAKIVVGQLNAYDNRVFRGLVDFAITQLEALAPDFMISGMALGWDQAIAQACVETGIPFIAAVPHKGQESQWPEKAQRQYHHLLGQATQKRVVSDGYYSPAKLHIRNQFMVDNATRVLALWDGSEGGTSSCVRYAESVKVPVTNCWPAWMLYSGARAHTPTEDACRPAN